MTNSNEMKYCINGRFLTRKITGVDRYAREIVSALDSCFQRGVVCILIPETAELLECPKLENIEIIRYGKRRGHLWEQLDLFLFVRNRKLISINLCNTAPILSPDIVCIHDMSVRAHPMFFSWKFRALYRMYFRAYARKATIILTVSEFSRREIEKYYPDSKGKVYVVPNAWQHIERVVPDFSVLNRNGLEEGRYYFAMSSLAPNKNLSWIVEAARLNPSEIFAVAGGFNSKVFGDHDIPQADNVKYLGYVSDCEAKALMASCKCFLYPTFYEGFGIPPMEALASGAPVVVVSDTEVMHEVYKNDVEYVDPRNAQTLSYTSPAIPKTKHSVLGRYSWQRSAEYLYCLLEKNNRQGD